jgi:hypothetical protein
LGAFVQKIVDGASTLTDDDVAELHRAHYTDDQIFEATVSAALGAGLFRLERVLNVLRASRPDMSTASHSPVKELAYNSDNPFAVTVRPRTLAQGQNVI